MNSHEAFEVDDPDRELPTSSSFAIRWAHSTKRALKQIKIPFSKAPSIIDKTRPYFSGIRHFGLKKLGNLMADPFHTLLNMPWGRFVMLFFSTYMVEFIVFAIIFYIMGDDCINGMDGHFSHALWLSSRTASTLGFDKVHPNPDCAFTNVVIMFEIIGASLINFIMLGLVFARFSAPFKRASTVRFSKNAVVHRHESGFWCLSMRVSNLRKHQILQPSVRMVVTAVDSITPSNYMFEHLPVQSAAQQETNLELGFPANLVHVIRPDSFLYTLSLAEMDTRMMEVLVFVDGIDAMTSKHMSARTTYPVSEINLNEKHVPLHLEMRGKQLGLDFTDFDATVIAWPELNSVIQAEVIEKGSRNSGMWTLRHQTFRKLAERFANLTPPADQLSASSNSIGSLRGEGSRDTNTPASTSVAGPSNQGQALPYAPPAGFMDLNSGLGLGSLGKPVQHYSGPSSSSRAAHDDHLWGNDASSRSVPAVSSSNSPYALAPPFMPTSGGAATSGGASGAACSSEISVSPAAGPEVLPSHLQEAGGVNGSASYYVRPQQRASQEMPLLSSSMPLEAAASNGREGGAPAGSNFSID